MLEAQPQALFKETLIGKPQAFRYVLRQSRPVDVE
jgi:hypothetical protein